MFKGMSMFRRSCFIGWVLCLGATAYSRADAVAEADKLLARAHALYADSQGFEATVFVRELSVLPAPNGAGASRVLSTAYQRVILTRGLPDNWRIISQREREVSGQAMEERTLAFGKTGGSDGAMLVLSQETQSPVYVPLPLVLFRQEVADRLGVFAKADPLFLAMFVNRAETGGAAFALEGASVAGRESENGVKLVRITATRAPKAVITLWIDERTGLLIRVLEGASREAPSGLPRLLRETLYRYDFQRGRSAADFDLVEGWALASAGIAAAAQFGDVGPLLAQAGSTEAAEGGVAAGPKEEEIPAFRSTQRNSPGAGDEPINTTAPAPPEMQLLTSEQMESVVMIEGDGGVGTGFVARLRGMDFVVTNLHVIGGNDKIRVTTLRGTKVPVAGMFGALGRDIAILRIEGTNTVPTLKLADDPIKTVKLGDKVAVVGNRRGGGVATQVSGTVRGLGPNRVEVDAPFQPGNSGSPILHVASGEVVGVASYSQTRELDELDGPSNAPSSKSTEKKTEQRWFGFRIDGVDEWESIDLVRWRDQAKRISNFEEDSEAIYYAMYGRFEEASKNARIRPLVERFEERFNRMGTSPITTGQVVQDFLHGLRSFAASGVKELNSGDYYNFFRTSEYWSTSIPQQLAARADLAKRLERATENSAAFLARIRR